MKPQTDAEIRLLVIQLRDGNAQAFEQLYRLHSAQLLSSMRSFVKDADVARELLQELYIKVWNLRHTLDPDKSYKTFLFTVARNLVFDYLRRMALDKRKRAELIHNALEFYTHVEESVVYKESEFILSQAMAQLPQQCRKVYTMSKLEGKSHEEISLLLQISIATVNNHMVKANRHVRNFFIKNGELSASLLLIVAFQCVK